MSTKESKSQKKENSNGPKSQKHTAIVNADGKPMVLVTQDEFNKMNKKNKNPDGTQKPKIDKTDARQVLTDKFSQGTAFSQFMKRLRHLVKRVTKEKDADGKQKTKTTFQALLTFNEDTPETTAQVLVELINLSAKKLNFEFEYTKRPEKPAAQGSELASHKELLASHIKKAMEFDDSIDAHMLDSLFHHTYQQTLGADVDTLDLAVFKEITPIRVYRSKDEETAISDCMKMLVILVRTFKFLDFRRDMTKKTNDRDEITGEANYDLHNFMHHDGLAFFIAKVWFKDNYTKYTDDSIVLYEQDPYTKPMSSYNDGKLQKNLKVNPVTTKNCDTIWNTIETTFRKLWENPSDHANRLEVAKTLRDLCYEYKPKIVDGEGNIIKRVRNQTIPATPDASGAATAAASNGTPTEARLRGHYSSFNW